MNLCKDLWDLVYWLGKDKFDENRISIIVDCFYYEWLGLCSRWMYYNFFMNVLLFVEVVNEIEKFFGVVYEKIRDFENFFIFDN